MTMRYSVALVSTCVLLGCRTPPAAGTRSQTQPGPMSADVEFLLTSAVTDFSRMPAASAPIRVREVRTGESAAPNVADGYNIVRWSSDGVAYWAVSDVDARELGDFVRLFKGDVAQP